MTEPPLVYHLSGTHDSGDAQPERPAPTPPAIVAALAQVAAYLTEAGYTHVRLTPDGTATFGTGRGRGRLLAPLTGLAALVDELTAYRALLAYTDHHLGCRMGTWPARAACTCGYTDALARLAALEERGGHGP